MTTQWTRTIKHNAYIKIFDIEHSCDIAFSIMSDLSLVIYIYIYRERERESERGYIHTHAHTRTYTLGKGPRGEMVKAMDCGIVVNEFELQSRYYVHFRTNTLWKVMNPLILPAMG